MRNYKPYENGGAIVGHGKAIGRDSLIALAGKADLKPRAAAAIVERVADAVTAWPRFAGASGVGAASRKRIAEAMAVTLGDLRA